MASASLDGKSVADSSQSSLDFFLFLTVMHIQEREKDILH
jgi:hypothetical protein